MKNFGNLHVKIHKNKINYVIYILFLTDFIPAKITVQLVNFADKYFANCQIFPILWIKRLRLFMRQHTAPAQTTFCAEN